MTIASEIMKLVLDQNIYKIMEMDIPSDKLTGGFLIGDVLREHLYRHIDFFANGAIFEHLNSLDKIKKMFGYKLGYYIRKWTNEEEKQGAIKAYAIMQEQFKELLISMKENT